MQIDKNYTNITQKIHMNGFVKWWCKRGFLIGLMALSLVATMLLSLPLSAQTASRLPTTELRGVWLTNVDSKVLFEKQRLDNALQNLKDLNFNIVYPTVWNWGWTLYPSQVAQRVIGRGLDPEPGLQGRDMLKEVVEEGHEKGFAFG
jgi:uncharacterized lipoprotein YddW (UPF0748 family)